MKRIYFLITLILSINCFVNAQDECAVSLQEAQNAFNNKNYQLTKILCSYITANCGNDYGNVQEMLQVIEEENKPTMTLSSKDIFVNGNEGDTAITVYCNKEWTVALNVSEMFYSISKKDSIIKIKYEENEGETIRHNYFDIQTTDGSISERINIYQFTKPKKQETKGAQPYLFIDKSKIYCSAERNREYITVKTNSEWDIQVEAYKPFSLTKQNDTLIVDIFENRSNYSHTEYFFIRTTDNSIIKKVTIVQSGNTQYETEEEENESVEQAKEAIIQQTLNTIKNNPYFKPNVTEQYTEPNLSVNKTSIYTTYDTPIEYFTVQCNKPWEIITTSDAFFRTEVIIDTVYIYLSKNYGLTRNNKITVRTKDGKREEIVSITQTGEPKNTYYKTTYNTTENTSTLAEQSYNQSTRLGRYYNNTGKKEISWFGLSLYGGFNIGFHASVLNLRYGLVELQPVNLGLITTIDYVGEFEFFYYQPALRVYIPTHRRGSIYGDLGAILCFDGTEYIATFLKAEIGFRFIPENRYAPTWDFFLRYNGGFCVGATMVLSTRFD